MLASIVNAPQKNSAVTVAHFAVADDIGGFLTIAGGVSEGALASPRLAAVGILGVQPVVALGVGGGDVAVG